MNPPDSPKLVRDFVPALARLDGADLKFDVVTPQERYALALDKLVEEAQELRRAEPEDFVARLAGVYELLSLVASAHGMSPTDVAAAAIRRDVEKGGFTKGFVLKEDHG